MRSRQVIPIGLRTSESQRAQICRAHTGLEVERASERVSWKLVGRYVRQEARCVDVDGMAAGRPQDRQTSPDERIGEPRRLLGAVLQ